MKDKLLTYLRTISKVFNIMVNTTFKLSRNLKTQKGLFVILGFIGLPITVLVPIIKEFDYATALKEFSAINITIAIGIITTMLAINKKNIERECVWIPLIQMVSGVISFYIGLMNDTFFSRVYLIINGTIVLISLLVTGKVIVDGIKGNKEQELKEHYSKLH